MLDIVRIERFDFSFKLVINISRPSIIRLKESSRKIRRKQEGDWEGILAWRNKALLVLEDWELVVKKDVLPIVINNLSMSMCPLLTLSMILEPTCLSIIRQNHKSSIFILQLPMSTHPNLVIAPAAVPSLKLSPQNMIFIMRVPGGFLPGPAWNF